MKITPQNIAVLDNSKDGLLSRWVERDQRLDQDQSLPGHYLRHIEPGDVVVDGGAAIGDHTAAYMQKCGDPSLVHAFEPNPLMLECLAYNCIGCHIHACALSDEDGVGRFHHINENAGASFLSSEGGIQVLTCRLDSFSLPKLDFMKLDLEGYEFKALSGAQDTLTRCKPRMVIEVYTLLLERAGATPAMLFDLLKGLGYGWNTEMGDLADGRAEIFCYPL